MVWLWGSWCQESANTLESIDMLLGEGSELFHEQTVEIFRLGEITPRQSNSFSGEKGIDAAS